MRVNIDVDSSISRKRLKIVKKDFWQHADIFFFKFYTALTLVGLLFPFYIFFEKLIYTRLIRIDTLIISIPFIVIGFLAAYTIANNNSLTSFKGMNEEVNRRILVPILQERFKVNVHVTPAAKILRIYKKATFWKFGTRVIVIFNHDEVLMNISRFNDRGLKSPFHTWFDYFKIQSIKKKFLNSL